MTYTINIPDDKDKKYTEFKYPAGESQLRLVDTELRTISEAKTIRVRVNKFDFITLALLTDALNYINPFAVYELILPYLPYSRADRRFCDGDCHGLKTVGNLIDSLASYDVVYTLDAHSYKAKHWISNLVDVDPLSLIKNAFNLIQYKNAAANVYPSKPVILMPDEGAKIRYTGIGTFADTILYCNKRRDPITGKLLAFEVPYLDNAKSVLIVDDICDGGGTFTGIVEKAEQQGYTQPFRDYYLYVTHGIFSKGFDVLKGDFEMIFTSDSFGNRDKSDANVFPTDHLFKETV